MNLKNKEFNCFSTQLFIFLNNFITIVNKLYLKNYLKNYLKIIILNKNF